MMGTGRSPNRLIGEKSPYLLQHAFNPVDWYPWGDEAFDRARIEEKPIFLSIGYSTCHWCHVMEHESFESEQTAEILNRFFVAIKVDREERPDVDRVYMRALQSMGQQGGWPMSMFLTPELQPFSGGTYFPPETRYGRMGFPELLLRVQKAWSADREKIIASAQGLTRHLRDFDHGVPSATLPGPGVIAAGLDAFARSFDPHNGGFGDAPKFPRPSVFTLLLRASRRGGRRDGIDMTALSLRKMSEGGLYDHLGGGFHRYSVDASWHVPHFEKMLYDQAQLVCVLLETMQASGEAFFGRIAREVLAYVLRDMTGAGGGFFCAEDADSVKPGSGGEQGEGAFYVWSMEELVACLGADDARLFGLRYGVMEEGNVENDPHGEFTGRNILHVTQSVEAVAQMCGRSAEEAEFILQAARVRLFGAREQRPRPFRDDKVLTAWNGLMISACARASRVLGDPVCLAAGTAAAGFILSQLRNPATGRLLRRWRDGEAGYPAHLDDYAFLVQGLLDLYESSFDLRWLREALELTRLQIAGFWDDAAGDLYDTSGEDPSILVRSRDLHDGAEPSGQSVATMNLLRLAHVTGDHAFRKRAERTLTAAGRLLEGQPEVVPLMGAALDFALGPVQEIVVVGSREEAGTRALLSEVARRYLPNAVVLLKDGDDGELEKIAPFVQVLGMKDSRPTAYVCRDHSCQLPVTDPSELGKLLDDSRPPKHVQ
jgi:uncharacterized protein